MHPLAERVRRTIARHELAPPGSRVIVGLSGGADSVALAHLLQELASPCGLSLAGLAHLNHQLRGPAADEDGEFCRDLARRLGLPIEVGRTDVSRLAATRHESLEQAGRTARYAFLEEAATRFGADRIAVGHTRDDQAETYLLRLLRGAGPQGLAGIRPRLGLVIRPLLDVTHAELRRYLDQRGVGFREDETNADTSIARNRVRHELLPLLARRFSPAIIDVLSREAAIAREDAALLDSLAASAAARLVHVEGVAVLVDRAALAAEPLAVARRVLRGALAAASGGRFVGFSQTEQVLALATGTGGRGPIDVAGQRVSSVGGQLVIHPAAAGRRGPVAAGPVFHYSLSIPGEVVVAECGCAVSAETAPFVADADSLGRLRLGHADQAVVDRAAFPAGLGVRNRRQGDRFRPLGCSGTKTLQDLFVDRKVPADRRSRVPVIVDHEDRIVWVAGHALDDGYKVTSETKSVVILKLNDLGARV